MYIFPPEYIAPAKLQRLSAKLPQGLPMGEIEPVTFPLKEIEEIFISYACNDTENIRFIDHCRLAMALMANLHTIMEGREESYGDLVWKYLREDEFVQEVFSKSKQGKVFAKYLQSIFIRYAIVKEPHLEFMEKFYKTACLSKGLPSDIALLVEIRSDQDGFLRKLAEHCLESGQEPLMHWFPELDQPPYDKYIQDNYFTPTEEYILDELFDEQQVGSDDLVISLLSFLLNFSDSDISKLVTRAERVIVAADKHAHLQKPVLEYFDDKLGIPPMWDRLPGIGDDVIIKYENLRGLVEFQYFELIAEIIYDKFLTTISDAEKTRLKNRTIFWMNYRDQISRIKIFSNKATIKYLRNHYTSLSKEYQISKKLLTDIGETEIDSEVVFILIGEVLIIEFFRGTGIETQTSIIPNGKKIFNKIKNSSILTKLKILTLREKAICRVKHRYLWQNAMFNFMSENLDIQVNRNTVLIPKSSSSDSLPGEREFNRVKLLKKEWAMSKTSKAIKENYGTDYTKFMNAIVTPC
jgi:hypothetical protein